MESMIGGPFRKNAENWAVMDFEEMDGGLMNLRSSALQLWVKISILYASKNILWRAPDGEALYVF